MLKNKSSDYYCRVCGLNQGFKPWGDKGDLPTFDICGCCGVQFGYEDCHLESIKEFREKWLLEGGNWSAPKEKPINWKPAIRLGDAARIQTQPRPDGRGLESTICQELFAFAEEQEKELAAFSAQALCSLGLWVVVL